MEGADCNLDLVLKVTCRIDYNQDVCTEGKSYVLYMYVVWRDCSTDARASAFPSTEAEDRTLSGSCPP